MKERISITIDRKLLRWVDEKVRERVFASRSHALAFLAREAMEQEREAYEGRAQRREEA